MLKNKKTKSFECSKKYWTDLFLSFKNILKTS